MRLVIFLLVTFSAFAQRNSQPTHTTESLRALDVVNPQIAWASGTQGTYLFTNDAGKTWTGRQVPGAESLDFRGVKVFGASAYLLAAGPGDASRIYHSRDLGEHWDLQFTNREPKGFLDCMAFFDEWHGLVVGDPVNGKFQILFTEDGGKTWQYADPSKMPSAVDGEGAFAASNTCLTTQGRSNAWFVTGGSVARVFRSTDGGKTWQASDTPIAHGTPSTGVFSVAFRDLRHGVIAGGDYQHPEQTGPHVATTHDGGKTWTLASASPQKFFSAVAYRSARENHVILVGSAVTAVSEDNLRNWKTILPSGFNAVVVKDGATYAAGANGTIGKLP